MTEEQERREWWRSLPPDLKERLKQWPEFGRDVLWPLRDVITDVAMWRLKDAE